MRFYLKSSIARINWINYTNSRYVSATESTRNGRTSHVEHDSAVHHEVFNLSQSRYDRLQGRVIEFCNQGPFDEGKEGLVPAGYTLLAVLMVMRHGDRSPMYTVPGINNPHLSCHLNTSGDNTTREFVRRMDAYVAKSSKTSLFRQYGMYPSSSSCAAAGLTPVGVEQMIRIGEHLRSRYTGEHNLFRSHTARPRQIYVRTTELSRTLHSAAAFLHGFLPRVDLSSIAIETTSNIYFCRERSGLTCVCPAVERAHAASKKSSRWHGSLLRTSESNTRRRISRLLNVSSSDLPWSGAIAEVLMTYECHGLDLPCAGRNATRCLRSKHLHSLWDFLDKTGAADAEDYNQHLASRLQVHPFLLEIISTLSGAVRGRRGGKLRRFSLYSGHDLTLSALAKALGVHNGQWPPYASRLIFELYGQKHDQAYVRVLFNGRDLTRLLQFCRESKEMCPFNNFMQFVRVESLRFFKSLNYRDACFRLDGGIR